MTKCSLAMVVLLVTALASATTIPITDTSNEGSPIALEGTFAFDQNSSVLTVVGHNKSPQAVLAVVAVVLVNPVINFNSEHDHYFSSMQIDVNRDFDVVETPTLPLDASDLQSLASQTSGTAKVLWVQFVDGTTWGDKQVESRIFRERQEIKAFLTHLLDVYNQSGADAFLSAVAEHQSSDSAEGMAEMYRDKHKTPAELVELISKQLAIGNSRK